MQRWLFGETCIINLGARPYPIIGTPSDFGANTVANTVISNLTCPLNPEYYNFFSCLRDTSVSSGGCDNGFSDEAVITCISCMYLKHKSWRFIILLLVPRPCETFETSLSYLGYSSSSNSYSVTIQVSMCIDNAYGNLCAAGITNEIANLICTRNGFGCKLNTNRIISLTSLC